MSDWILRGLCPALLCLGAGVLVAQSAPAQVVDAARSGERDKLQQLLEGGANPDQRSVDSTTALHWAVRADDLAALRLLISAGADVSIEDRYGVRPLYLAAINGSAEAIGALLDAGASARAFAPNGETMLMTAARTGTVAALSLLLDRGADIDARDTEFEQTALMLAVREGHPHAVRLLIERGADVNAQTRFGPIPEFVPPCKGTGCGSEGVGINRGGLPDRGRRAARRGGMSALLSAARDGRTEEARLLIDAGADIELTEANRISPLLMATLNNHLEIAGILLDAGAEPSVDDFWGRTPLFAAVEYRNLDMNNREQDSPTHNDVERAPVLVFIRRLLEQGADVNARTREVPPSRRWLYSLNDVSWVDFTGQTPFLRAAFSGDTDSMRLLLDYGADPNIATFAGTTPLMAAAGVNWTVAQTFTESDDELLEAIRICLDHGADVNATNTMGLTALLGAVNKGADEIVEFLWVNGARLDAVDAEGRTARRWAEGVFLAAVGAERKPSTIALLERLEAEQSR